ncbi:hypothetical protein K435DRAFT_858542 [Dendrothele bispora CBS 962.96]|uniref:Uncharacterized protein n=1 Tax=Dendrothele bispora (strain CBS 962.96) TaxID=1314807 RepID=A0A4S8M2S9_DENBC|nr:hypothetical protein K435DRAFT_858542 [Dendrothele bispora CBS 962.96]
MTCIASKLDDYGSELHLDLFRTFKRVNHGGQSTILSTSHTSLHLSPNLTANKARIAPEAFNVISAEFGEEINCLGHAFFSSTVKNPFIAVNKKALFTGTFGTDTSEFHRGDKGWLYSVGDFAQQTHPLTDSVELTIMRNNTSGIDVITVGVLRDIDTSAPTNATMYTYNSRTDRALALSPKLLPIPLHTAPTTDRFIPSSLTYAQQQPLPNPSDARRHPLNILLDASPLTDIDLPEQMRPYNLAKALNPRYSVAQFHLSKDNNGGPSGSR